MFNGILPADNPRLQSGDADEPQEIMGGVAAAPVFKNIGEQILTCFRTPLRQNPSPLPEEEIAAVDVKLVSAGPFPFGQSPSTSAVKRSRSCPISVV